MKKLPWILSAILLVAFVGVALFGHKGGAPILGSGNTALVTSVQKADICKFNTSATTTLCSLYNGDSDSASRYVSSITIYFTSSTAFNLTAGTSTVAVGTTASALWNSTAITATTLLQTFTTSSGFATTSHRIWDSGAYLNIKADSAANVSGFVKVVYDKQPT